jgi:hypothetical protein
MENRGYPYPGEQPQPLPTETSALLKDSERGAEAW